MNTGQAWITEILPLDRPEYAKQPEALLTDLVWRSVGSSLSNVIPLSRDSSLVRLVPRRVHGRKPGLVETMPIAEETDACALILSPSGVRMPVGALLNSVLAPKSRGDKSLACVPVHPDAVVLQTLHGLVSKLGPPNLAKVIETVGWLGGSGGRGYVAHSLLEAMSQQANSDEGFTGLVDTLFPEIAKYTWSELVKSFPGAAGVPPEWPGVGPTETLDSSLGPSILANYKWTPFRWFWEKWDMLCNNGWYNVLPARRFIDWATCLLRTGLSFAYLWEADFFVKLHACISEKLSNQENHRGSQTAARDSLQSMLRNGTILATIEAPRVPATQKHAWNALSTLLARGYVTRKRFEEHLSRSLFSTPRDVKDVWSIVEAWIDSLLPQDMETLSEPLQVDSNTAPNTREFVRYLLLPRSSDDDTRDQADFYYLARTNSRRLVWFQPGPEWLVVVTSLLGKYPGGKCTLGMLLDDLRMLGLRVERGVLVGMLEEAGLSMDSPDADNALVIQAGF